ncbi:MAG: flagellar motor protein MotD [Chromatiales bacterium]|jgi:chemotaxis protein MotB|nr:flagellar motor protein MotD [Chromatiales bacterium]
MGRRKAAEEHENHERWLVSYADFITLLFAFFVVMYALSSVNEGKYRVLTDSIASGFRGAPRSLEPIQVGSLVRARTLAVTANRMQSPNSINLPRGPVDRPLEPIKLPPKLNRAEGGPAEGDQAGGQNEAEDKARAQQRKALDEFVQSVENESRELLDKKLLRIRRTENWVELELNQSMLFEGASARVRSTGTPVLTEIAQRLKGFPNAVHVEGHADSRPIKTSVFPSNWELSAARAASVVNFFMGQGVDAQRLAAIGYGQFRPIASNDTSQGRRRNRRVVIVIHSNARDPREQISTSAFGAPAQ